MQSLYRGFLDYYDTIVIVFPSFLFLRIWNNKILNIFFSEANFVLLMYYVWWEHYKSYNYSKIVVVAACAKWTIKPCERWEWSSPPPFPTEFQGETHPVINKIRVTNCVVCDHIAFRRLSVNRAWYGWLSIFDACGQLNRENSVFLVCSLGVWEFGLAS